MTAPQLTKAWTITPNVRNAYVSLNDMAAWWFYNNHVAIVAKWTLWWTSDGTTGPANAADHTDRLLSKANCTTRATVAAAAQSWAVYKNTDGVMLKITYQGASDDILKIAYSRAGLYTLAGTTTQEPTATDEVSFGATTIVGNGTSLDRVMSVWVRDDGRAWSCATFRSGALQCVVGLEQVTSLCTVRVTNPIFDVPYALYKHTDVRRSDGTVSGTLTGAASTSAATGTGIQIRCYTDSARTIPIGAGELSLYGTPGGGNPGANSRIGQGFNNVKPAAQNNAATPLLPLYWSGPPLANQDGFFATPIDWLQGIGSSSTVPAQADPFAGYDPGDNPAVLAARSNWWVTIGSAMVRPWRNVDVSLVTS